MRPRVFAVAVASILLSMPRSALGQECLEPSMCVPKQDMDVFIALLREKQCFQRSSPEVHAGRITIITDKQGRVYASGWEPHPYQVKIKWCSYEIVASGHMDVVAGVVEEPYYGFRFRPKVLAGILAVPSFDDGLRGGVDAGVLVDFVYWRWLNLNASVGFRSLGVGPGVDITSNFGVYAGYATTWGTWKHTPHIGAYFAF